MSLGEVFYECDRHGGSTVGRVFHYQFGDRVEVRDSFRAVLDGVVPGADAWLGVRVVSTWQSVFDGEVSRFRPVRVVEELRVLPVFASAWQFHEVLCGCGGGGGGFVLEVGDGGELVVVTCGGVRWVVVPRPSNFASFLAGFEGVGLVWEWELLDWFLTSGFSPDWVLLRAPLLRAAGVVLDRDGEGVLTLGFAVAVFEPLLAAAGRVGVADVVGVAGVAQGVGSFVDFPGGLRDAFSQLG